MSEGFYGRIDGTLATLRQEGTYKTLGYMTGPMSSHVDVEGVGRVLVMCSNDYLGFAAQPDLVAAGQAALREYGAGAASVRFICGTSVLHRRLEERTAAFLGKEASLAYTSCWNANTAAIPALLAAGDAVISDALNHASLIDGCRAVGKDVRRLVYRHADIADLERCLMETADCGTRLVVTDGVFSMEGDVAPLPGIVDLARRFDAITLVDDSHATGVLGATGRGTEEHFGMQGAVDIVTGTYGKALGGAGGGFVAARRPVVDLLVQRSRPSLFSNALPPVLTAIALAAVERLDAHPEAVRSLREKALYLRNALKAAGLRPLEGETAIVPLMVGETAQAIALSARMLEKGLFAIGFGFPVVPEGAARIRLQVSNALTYDDLAFAVRTVVETMAGA
jgi:glycine C-acetyltransferase